MTVPSGRRRGRCCSRRPGLPFYPERTFADSPFDPGPGYFAVTRHEDVWHASRNADLFCSGKGSNIADLPQELNEFYGSMINMDDPKHFRLRSIVSKGFTPKHINAVDGQVRQKASELVDRLLDLAPGSHGRFRRRVLGTVPARDHLLDDGHPGVRQSPAVRVDEHDPRRRRPRVRRHLRAADGGLVGDLRLRPGTRRGPPGTSHRRSHLGVDGGRGRRRSAHTAGVRIVLHPARGGGQRDHAQRDQPRRQGAHRLPGATPAVVRRLRRRTPARRSRRSCVGRPR